MFGGIRGGIWWQNAWFPGGPPGGVMRKKKQPTDHVMGLLFPFINGLMKVHLRTPSSVLFHWLGVNRRAQHAEAKSSSAPH